jgi:hypothetical protein
VLTSLLDVITESVAALPEDWAQRYVATRRLILTAPSLLGHVEYARSGVEAQVAQTLTDKLALPEGDLRPRILAELVTTAWSIAGRGWVTTDGTGGRPDLLERLKEAFAAVPEALDLST